MKQLAIEQKVEALIATSPLRYLQRDRANFWVSWDEKYITVAGIKMGDMVWTRPALAPAKKLKILQFVVMMWGRKPQVPELKDYSIVDLFGQRWIGRGYPGQATQFVKEKEIG